MASLQATAALQTLRSEAALQDLLAHPVQFSATTSLAGGAESAAALAGLQGLANVIVVNPASAAEPGCEAAPLDPVEAEKRAKADGLALAQAERHRRLQEQDATWSPPSLDWSALSLPPHRLEVGAPAIVPAPSHNSDMDPTSDESLALMATVEALLAVPPLGAVLSDGPRRTMFLPPSARAALALKTGAREYEHKTGSAQVLGALAAILSSTTSARIAALPQALLDLAAWSPASAGGHDGGLLALQPYSVGHLAFQLLSALQEGPGRGVASLVASKLEVQPVCGTCRATLGEARQVTLPVLALPSLVEGEAPADPAVAPDMGQVGSSKERRKRKRAALQAHAKLVAHPPPRPVGSVQEALEAYWAGAGVDHPGSGTPPGGKCEAHPDAQTTCVRRVLASAPALAVGMDAATRVALDVRVAVGGASYKLAGVVARAEDRQGRGWEVSAQPAPGGPWRALDVSPGTPWTSVSWRARGRVPTHAGRGGVLALYTRQTRDADENPEPDGDVGGKRRKRAKKSHGDGHGHARVLASLARLVSAPAAAAQARARADTAPSAAGRARVPGRTPGGGGSARPARGSAGCGGEDLGELV